jgi:hypothetical protein
MACISKSLFDPAPSLNLVLGLEVLENMEESIDIDSSQRNLRSIIL